MANDAKTTKSGKTWAASADAVAKPGDDRLMSLVITRIKERQAAKTADRNDEQSQEDAFARAM